MPVLHLSSSLGTLPSCCARRATGTARLTRLPRLSAVTRSIRAQMCFSRLICPPYALRALVKPLRAFLAAQQPQEPTFSRPRPSETVWGDLAAGQRNETIFQTIRRAAYRGEDYEALAYELNSRCEPPLPLSEVAGIVRSVEKFMREKYTPKSGVQSREPMPEQVREFLSEIGRKGGSRKTEAQRAALAKGSRAGNIVKSAQAVGRRAQIQELKKAGYKQREVAEKMGLGIATVKRAWN